MVSLLAERGLFTELGGYREVLCGGDSELYERLKLREGRGAYAEVDMPLIYGLWSSQSLTQQNGLEATEDGFRSLARRAYAEAATRRRLLGPELMPDAEVDAVNRRHGIHRPARGVEPLS